MNGVRSVTIMVGHRQVSMASLAGPYGPLYVIRRDKHEIVHDNPEHAHTLFCWAVRDAKREQAQEVAA